jgi:large subunit ribosomal protein L32
MACDNCSKPRIAHRICPHCGFYAGRAVIHAREE